METQKHTHTQDATTDSDEYYIVLQKRNSKNNLTVYTEM